MGDVLSGTVNNKLSVVFSYILLILELTIRSLNKYFNHFQHTLDIKKILIYYFKLLQYYF